MNPERMLWGRIANITIMVTKCLQCKHLVNLGLSALMDRKKKIVD